MLQRQPNRTELTPMDYFIQIYVDSKSVSSSTVPNQITVVAFQSIQLAQASFLQKNQTLQNIFLISVMLR